MSKTSSVKLVFENTSFSVRREREALSAAEVAKAIVTKVISMTATRIADRDVRNSKWQRQ